MRFLALIIHISAASTTVANVHQAFKARRIESRNALQNSCLTPSFDLSVSQIDQNVLIDFEGLSSKTYHPSDRSGPTIGAGLDLGTAGEITVRRILTGSMSSHALHLALTAHGLRGAAAEDWISKYRDSVVIDSCFLRSVAAKQYECYWRYASKDFNLDDAPSAVRTAIVSFTMHTGNVGPLAPALRSHDWEALASVIETYHDDWEGPEGPQFQKRRRLEAKLIRMSSIKTKEVDYD